MKMAAKSHTASEPSLEELLALYGYTVPDPEKETCLMAASMPDRTLSKGQITDDLFNGEKKEDPSAYDLTSSNTSDLLRRLQGGDKATSVSSSDEDSDDASIPSNEEHKEIMVGSMYQAKIPPLNPYSYRERAYSGEDQLLWKPGLLSVQEVEEFLLNAQRPRGQEGAVCAQGATVQDNEQALYELVKCNFNAEEALRRLCFNVKVFSDELCSWSEEECRNFEHGYRVYGKNFHLIQANKTTRLSRKKYSLQSGSVENGDQDGEGGDLEESNSSSGLLSHSTMSAAQLESPLPLHSNLDLKKETKSHDDELVMSLSELCGDECPQQLFECPFSFPSMDNLRDPGSESCCPSSPVQLQSQPLAQSSQWACQSSPSHRDDHGLRSSCFYQLHMHGEHFASEGSDCGTAGEGADTPHRLQMDFSLPSAPPSSSVFSSHFQVFGSLLHPSPIQHPRSLTQ
ncbi:mesoderm induction early response protein 2 isoform X2 [Melanotaenia boesemani]|uniref:mesoderm induction early response protein 2 isoform X2 n=1 Tax=Melanotaenia boesemani TaxID=1250792 RepID=UPI001C058D99|nr:mesoderm induction early response protein 2 isoform X2 [Melanotaenia boesemani]